MKDLQIKVRIYNNQLKERREGLGASQIQMAKIIGVPIRDYSAFELLKLKPYKLQKLCPAYDCSTKWTARTGWCPKHQPRTFRRVPLPRTELTWCPHALKIAEYFEVPIEELFPAGVLEIAQSVMVKKFDAAELPALMGSQEQPALLPDESFDRQELRSLIEQALGALPKQQEIAVRAYFGLTGTHGQEAGMTREEVAKFAGVNGQPVTPERIRQLLSKAVGNMQRSYRNRHLRDFT